MNVFLYIMGIIVTLIGAYFAILKFGSHIWNIFNKTHRRKVKAYQLIKQWYDYIDANLDSLDMNQASHFESEVDLFFSDEKNKHLSICFDEKFRKKFLKEMGVKKELLKDVDLLKSYARLASENISLGIGIHESASNRKVTLEKFPFQFYWYVIRGNFYNFYSQYKNNYDGIAVENRCTWADIEIPVRMLCRLLE